MLNLQPAIPSIQMGQVKPLEAVTREQIESAESRLIEMILFGSAKEAECILTETFAPGVYIRELVMPAKSFIIGHEHKTKHVNIVTSGKAYVMMNGEPFLLEAPHTFVSEPGVRKVLYILEEMRFITVHPTNETDLDKLSEELIVKSNTFESYEADLQKFRELLSLPNE